MCIRDSLERFFAGMLSNVSSQNARRRKRFAAVDAFVRALAAMNLQRIDIETSVNQSINRSIDQSLAVSQKTENLFIITGRYEFNYHDIIATFIKD